MARGERGEICLRTGSNPHYPLDYWNRPQEDSDDVFADEIKAYVREHHSAYAYPRVIEVVTEPAKDAHGQDPPYRAAPARARWLARRFLQRF